MQAAFYVPGRTAVYPPPPPVCVDVNVVKNVFHHVLVGGSVREPLRCMHNNTRRMLRWHFTLYDRWTAVCTCTINIYMVVLWCCWLLLCFTTRKQESISTRSKTIILIARCALINTAMFFAGYGGGARGGRGGGVGSCN